MFLRHVTGFVQMGHIYSWSRYHERYENRCIVGNPQRSIVATGDRWCYDQCDRSLRLVDQSIVRPIVRLPIRDHPQRVTMHDWWYDHVRPICDRLRFGIAGYKFLA